MTLAGGALFAALGLGAGTYATIIGAGGGFIVTPVLLLVLPQESPALVTGIGLAVAGLNSISGSVAYARYRRIDYRTGVLAAGGLVPGAAVGAWLTRFATRGSFDLLFGVVLLALSTYIARRPSLEPARSRVSNVTRTHADSQGNTYTYAFNRELVLALSLLAGIVAGLMGVGGGIILVPFLVRFAGIPPRLATATILFAVIFMALAATALHLSVGDLGLEAGWLVLAVGTGVVVGAQLGSRLSQRLRSQRILQLLSLALAGVGIRLLLQGTGLA